MRVDKIVECRQIGPAPLKVVNPALRSLLERSLAQLDPLQLGIDVTPESAVVSRSGVPSERLFAIGPVTRPAFWEIIAIPDICNQCAALANLLRRALPGPYRAPHCTPRTARRCKRTGRRFRHLHPRRHCGTVRGKFALQSPRPPASRVRAGAEDRCDDRARSRRPRSPRRDRRA